MRTTDNNTEQQILKAAKQVFLEKGFAETSMNDIAEKAGINRPNLHYYFRTKEKMFEAVCGDIVYSFLPMVQDIIKCDRPIEERISEVVDIYFDVFKQNPCLPLFMAREVQRDATHLLCTIKRLEVKDYMAEIPKRLLQEMKDGKIKEVPIEYLFYTFYGLVVFPFLAKPLSDVVFERNEKNADVFQGWKKYVVRQLESLLLVGRN